MVLADLLLIVPAALAGIGASCSATASACASRPPSPPAGAADRPEQQAPAILMR